MGLPGNRRLRGFRKRGIQRKNGSFKGWRRNEPEEWRQSKPILKSSGKSSKRDAVNNMKPLCREFIMQEILGAEDRNKSGGCSATGQRLCPVGLSRADDRANGTDHMFQVIRAQPRMDGQGEDRGTQSSAHRKFGIASLPGKHRLAMKR